MSGGCSIVVTVSYQTCDSMQVVGGEGINPEGIESPVTERFQTVASVRLLMTCDQV